MNKFKLFLIILISIITIFLVTIYMMYRNDMKRMKNGEPVKYSNWGYAYSTLDIINDEEQIRYNELQETEQKILNLLYEYYGQEEIENLYKKMEENSIKNGEYAVSEYAEEMLDKLLTLVESKPISNDEKTMLIDIMEQMDLESLNNIQIEKRLQSVGIKIDK